MGENNILYIVVPCYNEEEVIAITAKEFKKEINKLIERGKISNKSKILYINDGSTDKTWDIIKKLSSEDNTYIGISQNRNRGHQSSLLAGLMYAKEYADITISIDCDGQDDINIMENMIDAYNNGAEIVYGVRDNRDTDNLFKRVTAEKFYKLMKRLGSETIYNHADYRLMSKKALIELSKFEESNLYIRGIVPLIGFNSSIVTYSRNNRIAGKSHYSLSKMIDLALNGLTNILSPLRILIYSGITLNIISIIAFIITVIINNKQFTWQYILWATMYMVSIQSIFTGILGEFLSKIYLETKKRPRYIIDKITNNKE